MYSGVLGCILSDLDAFTIDYPITIGSNCAQQIPFTIRAVASGGGAALAVFGQTVNPISTSASGADYTHHSTTRPPPLHSGWL